ncbi:MAG: carboxypeptidase-like regulatory domain-containing protein [Planctomycetota bacterium]
MTAPHEQWLGKKPRGKSGLSAEGGLLLVLAAGTLALVGLPDLRRDSPPAGAVIGRVLDESGKPCPEVSVLLYAGEGTSPAELTHTDAAGRFAFQQSYAHFHVLALPEARTRYCPAWAVDLTPADAFVPLALPAAMEVDVSVETETGSPIHNAELVVLTPDLAAPLALQLARTDKAGRAVLAVPPLGSVGARVRGFRPGVGTPEGPGRLRIPLQPDR